MKVEMWLGHVTRWDSMLDANLFEPGRASWLFSPRVLVVVSTWASLNLAPSRFAPHQD
jgi:hypothetical protein